MRSALLAVSAVGGLLLLDPGAAQARWWLHPYPHPHFYHAAPASPYAAPMYFQLPFGFGVNVSGLQVQGPLGNRINLGDQGNQNNQNSQPAPQITIDASTKQGITEMKSDLNALLAKTNKLSSRMYNPKTMVDADGKPVTDPTKLKAFKPIPGATPAKKGGAAGGEGGAKKDSGGVSTNPF